MEGKDWAIVFATLFGPIFAVQAQKRIEALREKRQQKLTIFTTVMTTRAARVSPEHVRALNMIDTVFHGRTIIGFRYRTKREKAVLDAWHDYLNHLNTPAEQMGVQVWQARSEQLFTDLLFVMSQAVGYQFDRVQLQRLVYMPVAHGEIEADQVSARKGLVRLLDGKSALKMEVIGFPTDPAIVAAQRELLQKMGTAFDEGALAVEIRGDNGALNKQ